MAKRTRKKPNIPQVALEQARQDDPDDESADSGSVATAPKTPAEVKHNPRRRRRELQAAQLNKRKTEGLDPAYVADRLANPTKTVTEAELQKDYGFVIKDLRNMGILAAVLFVALIAISLVIL